MAEDIIPAWLMHCFGFTTISPFVAVFYTPMLDVHDGVKQQAQA